MIGLSEAISKIEAMQEVVTNKEKNILCTLPEVYSDFDIYKLTNFFLQMDFDGKHYYKFIKDRLLENELLKDFEISVETRGIKLRHNLQNENIYSMGHYMLKISYGDRTYDSSYLEDQQLNNKRVVEGLEKEIEEKEDLEPETYYNRIMRGLGEYIENPSLKSRLNLYKLSIDKFSIKDIILGVRNMFVSDKKMQELYKIHMEREQGKERDKEHNKERIEKRIYWIENQFSIVEVDTLRIIEYLKGLGYTYRKDI